MRNHPLYSRLVFGPYFESVQSDSQSHKKGKRRVVVRTETSSTMKKEHELLYPCFFVV
ncbi:hypothetical protein HMPREF0666_00259 [Prevotella sp. C561]|nr:hypothetical protein HMPREF0666_00259 [Prevotella sp. C561]